MAQVWAARLVGTRGFRKVVAIKTILQGTMDDRRMEEMFLQEATLASHLQHPNIVQTLELGEHDGLLYLVMEWVDGEPLHTIVTHAQDDGGLPLSMSVNIVGQALRGLHAAHEQRDENGAPLGLVHRDMSPQNVLVTYDGTTKLVDFGIAKATARATVLTDAGEVKGKVAYVSPEQVSGLPVDRRSDIFSIGVLLYLLTTGRHPFKGESASETVRNIASPAPALPPSAIVADYPPALEAVILRALQKPPEARFATAEEMACALEEAMPQCLERSFDAKVGEYLSSILGSRGIERRRQLRLAEERIDRGRDSTGQAPSSSSYGSLRAVSIERTGSEIIIRAEPTALREAPLSGTQVVEFAPRRGRQRKALWGAGLVLCGIMAGLGARGLSSEPTPDVPAAAASPVPNATLESGHIAPEPAALAAPATPSAEATVDEPSPPSKPAARATALRPQPASAPATLRRSAPQRAVPKPGEATKQPVEAPKEAKSPGAPKVLNAWDPSSFGSRH